MSSLKSSWIIREVSDHVRLCGLRVMFVSLFSFFKCVNGITRYCPNAGVAIQSY